MIYALARYIKHINPSLPQHNNFHANNYLILFLILRTSLIKKIDSHTQVWESMIVKLNRKPNYYSDMFFAVRLARTISKSSTVTDPLSLMSLASSVVS